MTFRLRKRTNEIHVNCPEAARRRDVLAKRRANVPRDFGTLAWVAFSAPNSYHLLHAPPYETLRNQLSSWYRALMRQTMESVENCPLEGHGNDRTGTAEGDVTQNGMAVMGDVLQDERRVCGLEIGDAGARALIRRKLGVINGRE